MTVRVGASGSVRRVGNRAKSLDFTTQVIEIAFSLLNANGQPD